MVVLSILGIIGSAIWFILPAYVANAAPVIFGGGRPIDGGKKFIDGRPIFGAGKTWRGLVFGIAAGMMVGLFQSLATKELLYYLPLSFLLASGALLGDMLGSFIKRRLGIKRGDPAPCLDQLDFVIVALLFATPFLPCPKVIMTILIVTPVLHLSTNFAGYKLGLKDRPY